MTATQTDRVLRALERAGARGITAVDFQLPDVIDGGPPILRVAARIEELADAGHRIADGGKRDRCKVYVIATTGEVLPTSPTTEPQGSASPAAATRLSSWWACVSCGTRTQGADPVMDCCDAPCAITFEAHPARAHASTCECARCDVGYPCAEARAAA